MKNLVLVLLFMTIWFSFAYGQKIAGFEGDGNFCSYTISNLKFETVVDSKILKAGGEDMLFMSLRFSYESFGQGVSIKIAGIKAPVSFGEDRLKKELLLLESVKKQLTDSLTISFFVEGTVQRKENLGYVFFRKTKKWRELTSSSKKLNLFSQEDESYSDSKELHAANFRMTDAVLTWAQYAPLEKYINAEVLIFPLGSSSVEMRMLPGGTHFRITAKGDSFSVILSGTGLYYTFFTYKKDSCTRFLILSEMLGGLAEKSKPGNELGNTMSLPQAQELVDSEIKKCE